MIRGAAELYRNFPNLYKEADGSYHIHHINNLENHRNTSDTPEELLAMNEAFTLAIHASEILGVDAEMRPRWKEVLDHLTPIPSSLEPAEYYDFCAMGTSNLDVRKGVVAAYQKESARGPYELTHGSTLSRLPIVACNLGLTDQVGQMMAALVNTHLEKVLDYTGREEWGIGVLRNRLALDEGPGAIECERLGMLSQTLHPSLLQSVPPSPEKEPVNYIFPTLPKTWDAQYTLAARSAFVISASQRNGQIDFVEIHSEKGGACRVSNPWGEAPVSLYRNGKESESVSGPLLTVATSVDETVTLVPKGKPLPAAMTIE
jgi:hypothetical protein